jgi:hypothetical protein
MTIKEIRQQFIDGYVALAKQQAEAMWPIYEQVYNKYPKDTPKEDIDKAFMQMVESIMTGLKESGDMFTAELEKKAKENEHE